MLKTEAILQVSIILPAYNEAAAIGKCIDDIEAVMKSLDYTYEIMVVDDCSKDKTIEISKAHGARVVERKVNRGAGAARKTGILAAKGEIIVMLDADGTYDPTTIPEMLKLFPAYDQVNGARDSEKGTLKPLRVIVKYLVRQLACYLVKYKIPDLNTGLKAFKRDIMLKYLWVIPDGFSCVTTMTLSFITNGYDVTWVPTRYYKRIGASKFHPVRDTMNYINTIVRIVLYFRPLRFFLTIAGLLFFIEIVKLWAGAIYLGAGMGLWDMFVLLTAVLFVLVGMLAELIVSLGRHMRGF